MFFLDDIYNITVLKSATDNTNEANKALRRSIDDVQISENCFHRIGQITNTYT